MSSHDVNVPVWQLVRGRQDRAQVLEGFGIDYCCGGATPLGEACARQGVSVEEVCRELEKNDGAHLDVEQIDWEAEPMARLVDHIVQRHHAYLREQLPRLGGLLEKVVARHGEQHPHLIELREVYAAMWNELLNHLMKEEVVLFPFVRELDQALRAGQPAPQFHCGSVRQPIHVMEDEHQSAGEALRRMRQLTLGFTPPEDACETYRVLMDGLIDLESDLHLHIHKENNLLFPRVAAAEASVLASRA